MCVQCVQLGVGVVQAMPGSTDWTVEKGQTMDDTGK